MAEIQKKTWRIIDTDNFGGDYPDEKFICIGIRSEEEAEVLCKAWNAKYCRHDGAPRFARVVPHLEIEYKLVPGFEP